MGLELVPQSPTIDNFVPSVRVGDLVFVAGHLPRQPDGTLLNSGKVGRDVTIEQGYEAARLAMINCLTSVKEAVGDLDKVERVVKLLVMVNATEDFDRQFLVGNGASDLLVELYGEQGRHARSAVGMGSLPLNCCVEIEMIVQVRISNRIYAFRHQWAGVMRRPPAYRLTRVAHRAAARTGTRDGSALQHSPLPKDLNGWESSWPSLVS